MVTTDDLIVKCKTGLQLDMTSTDLDGLLEQKVRAVKVFMSNAGVSANQLDTDLAVGAIVLGVSDMWNIQGGSADFSGMFHLLVSQLKFVSMTEGV